MAMKVMINDEEFDNDFVDCDIVIILPNKQVAKMSSTFIRSFAVAMKVGTANHIRLKTRDDVIISRRLMGNDDFIAGMPLAFLTTMADVTHVCAARVMNAVYMYMDAVTSCILDETFKKKGIPRLNMILEHFDQETMGDDDVDVSRRLSRLYDALVDGRVGWCLLTHLSRDDSHYAYIAIIEKVNPMHVIPSYETDSSEEIIPYGEDDEDDEDSGDEMIM